MPYIIFALVISGIYHYFGSTDTYATTKKAEPYTSSYESSRDDYQSSDSFHGNDCTDDCSGHEAGYNWAEEKDISDEDDCDTSSNSFNEGCVSYVEENN